MNPDWSGDQVIYEPMNDKEATKPIEVNCQESIFKRIILAVNGERRMLFIVCAFLLILSLSEYLTTSLATVQVGLVGHGLSLVALLLLSALIANPKEQRIYLTLSFAPLIRLISLSLPLQGFQKVYWYLLVGLLVYIAIFFVFRYGQFTLKGIGVTANYWFLQLLFGLVGIGIGYIEYLILKPEALIEEMTLAQIWLPALILIVFTGILEEVVFRGLMQTAFAVKFNRWLGIVLISTLFAVLHLGYQSLLEVIFVFCMAVLFGIVTQLTESILGVSLAHGLTNVTLFLIFPFIIGQGLQPLHELPLLGEYPEKTAVSTQIDETQSTYVVSEEFTSSPSPTITPTPTILSGTKVPTKTDTPKLFATLTATEVLQPIIVDDGDPGFDSLGTEAPKLFATITATEVLQPIIVDDGDPGFDSVGVERWECSQGYQGGLLWTFTRFDEPDVFVVWTPEIKHCGQYQFEVYIPEDFGQAQSITYAVTHLGGLTEIEINQDIHQGEWVLLGSFWCEVGTDCKVSADNLMSSSYQTTFVAFDALRLTLLETCN